MISILIPIYNFNCLALVQDLVSQVNKTAIKAEILCIDDASDVDYLSDLEQIKALPGTRFISLSKNIGRSAIRNRLAEESQYPWLLFLDNDGIPEYPDFLLKYVKATEEHTYGIICGGRTYDPAAPVQQEYYLHWLYGTRREVQSPSGRNNNPYYGFQSNNFLIDKNSFNRLRFDESIVSYGHEDTRFGMKAAALSIPIYHIDNPMRHIGLETAEQFLKKAETACENAWTLYQSEKKIVGKALKHAIRIKKGRFHFIAGLLLNLLEPWIRDNLLGKKPILLALDLYKLQYLLKIVKQ